MSKILLEIEILTRKTLEKLKDDLLHQLTPYERFTIYKSFGSFNRMALKEWNPQILLPETFVFSFADIVLSWLSILTAREVLPIWIQDQPERNAPERIIGLAERFLLYKDKRAEVIEAASLFSGWLSNADIDVGENVYQAACAAFGAYELVVSPAILLTHHDKPNVMDEDLRGNGQDFARAAAKAFEFSDNSEDWTIEYDLDKRLQFWQWWLTEAIPQAWELAEQSFSSK